MNIKTLNEKVIETIAGSTNRIVDSVVNKLAETEITRRIDLVGQAISIAEILRKELSKCKPDIVQYSEKK